MTDSIIRRISSVSAHRVSSIRGKLTAKNKLKLFKALKALSARLLFIGHSILAIWRVTVVYKDPIYWCFAIILALLAAEAFLNVYFRGGDETVGFCMCVFLYSCSVVPAIWLLELSLVEKRRMGLENSDQLDLSHLSDSLWAQGIEQLLLVVIIMGRWLLPKGEMSRDELSQLLLVYAGTAADIAELFETFKEPKIKANTQIIYIVLGIWSWSLLQFSIVLSSGAKNRRRMVRRKPKKNLHKEPFDPMYQWFLTNLDVRGIMLSTLLQDGPFFVIRIYMMAAYHVVSYMMIFFTCKNTLVLMLQIYRLSALILDHRNKLRRTKRKKAPKFDVIIKQKPAKKKILDSDAESALREALLDLPGQAKASQSVPVQNRAAQYVPVSVGIAGIAPMEIRAAQSALVENRAAGYVPVPVGAGGIVPVRIGAGGLDSTQMIAAGLTPVQIGATGIAPTQFEGARTVPLQIGATEVGPMQIRAEAIDRAQVLAEATVPGQIGATTIAPTSIGAIESVPVQMGALRTALLQVGAVGAAPVQIGATEIVPIQNVIQSGDAKTAPVQFGTTSIEPAQTGVSYSAPLQIRATENAPVQTGAPDNSSASVGVTIIAPVSSGAAGIAPVQTGASINSPVLHNAAEETPNSRESQCFSALEDEDETIL